MRLHKSVVMVLLAVQLASGQRCQLLLQINIIPVIAVFNEGQLRHNALEALLRKIIDAVHFKRLAAVLLAQLLHQQRQILVAAAEWLDIKINIVALNLQQQKIMRLRPINMVAVTPYKQIRKGALAAILMRF